MTTPDDNSPLVSAITLTYMHEDYIGRCIESILMQETDFAIELIVGTDCSPDGTDEIVRQYAERYPDRVRAVFRDKNVGARANFYDVCGKARGKYIAWCEGDDEWTDPKKLQKQVAILEERPDIVLVHTDIDRRFAVTGSVVRQVQKRVGLQASVPEASETFDALMQSKIKIYTPTVCMRTAAYNTSINDISDVLATTVMADTPSFIELTRHGRFAFISDTTALMNRLQESASRSESPLRKAEFMLGGIEMRLAMAKRSNYQAPNFDKALSRTALVVLRQCVLGNGDAIAKKLYQVLPTTVPITWQHRLLTALIGSRLASSAYRIFDGIAFNGMRKLRDLRYAVKSRLLPT